MLASVKKFTKENIFNFSLFRTIYILSLMFSFLCLVEVPCQVVTYVLMLWALILVVYKLKKDFKKIYCIFILFCFISSSIITSFLHIRDNFFMNLLMTLHVSICFFIFYSSFTEKRAKVKNEMYRLFKIIVISSTIITIFGLLIASLFPRTQILGYFLGLRDNRYVGLYTNANLSAFISVVSIIFCVFLFKKKGLSRWLLLTCAISNFVALILSDSNSSLIFLIIFSIVLTTCWFYKTYCGLPRKKVILKAAVVFPVCIICCLSSVFIRIGFQHGVAVFMNSIHSVNYTVSPTGDDSTEIMVSLGRNNEKNRDISSGRTESIRKSFVLFAGNPIMGVGKSNIVEYGNRYLAKGFTFSDLHNGYLTVLISYGIMGMLLFLAFSILVAKSIITSLFQKLKNNKGSSFSILFSFLTSYCAFAFLEKTLLLDITFMVVSFWLVLGYSMGYIPDITKKRILNLAKYKRRG